MDIILKFGEHYYETCESSFWVQFILTFIGAFLGFGSALYFYYKSFKKEKKQEKNKLNNENKNRIKYHNLLTENLINNTESQIESLQNFKKEQEKDLLNINVPKRVSTNDFQRLIFINKEIFDSFNYINRQDQDNDWIEVLKTLHKYVDFIEGTFKRIEQLNENYMKNYMSNAIEIKQIIEMIPNKLTSITFYLEKEYGEKKWESKLYAFADSEIKKFSNLVERNANFNDFNNEYLYPMLNSILRNFENESIFEEIIFLAKNARVKINDLKTIVQDTIDTCDSIQNSLINALKKVKESNGKLIKHETKPPKTD